MDQKKTFYIETYGCEMNKSDSIDIRLSFERAGYLCSTSSAGADVIVINTCSVRENAEERVRGRLGYFRSLVRERPAVIVFAGCMAQEHGEVIMKFFPEIKVVAGTCHFMDIPGMVEEYGLTGEPVVDVSRDNYRFSSFRGKRAEDYRAWVTIIKGCTNFCSYCIVPYLRGPEKSKPSEEIKYEIEELVSRGVVEITLLGQNVNAYGKDSGDIKFIDLLELINDINGLRWIRFLTSHPRDFDVETIRRMSALGKVCKHYHVPVQSGSDRILELMNRGYTVKHYLELIDAIRQYIPGASITTDIIVGYPSETEEDFAQTLDIVEKIGYDDAFTYRYSTRPYTRSAEMDSDPEVGSRRLSTIIEMQRRISHAKNLEWIGREIEVLVERKSRKSPAEYLCRTSTNRMVVVPTRKTPGKFLTVRVEGISGNTLRAAECVGSGHRIKG